MKEGHPSLWISGQEQSVIVGTDPGGGKYVGATFYINGKSIHPRENSEGKEFIGPLDPNQKNLQYMQNGLILGKPLFTSLVWEVFL